MDYITSDKIAYFNDCEPLVSGLGYSIVELNVFKSHSNWHIKVVITSSSGVGIADCSKVHRALLPRLEAVLNSQDMHVEVASPGLDRIMKNASEFTAFTGRQVKVWNSDISDWMQGIIVSSNTDSVRLRTESGECDIPYTKIAKAKLFS